MSNAPHTYEEIREVVIDIVLKKVTVSYDPNQYGNLTIGVAEVFHKRETPAGQQLQRHSQPRLIPADLELVRDVFWDLFRQGMITLGMNDSNDAWPWFRLSYIGSKTLASQSPYRFHDSASYLTMVRQAVPDISDAAISYLDEAVQTFYSGCLFASCVMLGVAAEAEFLRLLDVAASNASHGTKFKKAASEKFVAAAVREFNKAIGTLVPTFTPKGDFENIDANMNVIQSIIRVARNDAGHPTGGTPPDREQVYVYLQLFVPLAQQIGKLRGVLT